jgi:AraC family transcriptional regulator
LNEPAEHAGASRPTEEGYQWLAAGHWYLWEGGFLLFGRGTGVVPPHVHHAIQIVVALDGVLSVCGADDRWREGPGLVVKPDVVHSFNANGAFGAMLFVDPESSEGSWLKSSLIEEITIVPGERLVSAVAELRRFAERPMEGMEIDALIRHCVRALSPGAPPARKLDDRITKVLNAIQSSDELRISLESAAAIAFLSPSRFAHLFTEQMGLPFRRYVLWRKLTRAMVAIGRGQTIADAAHAADFADAAHLTRTFYQMFGMAPSALMRGRFSQIASPFTAR